MNPLSVHKKSVHPLNGGVRFFQLPDNREIALFLSTKASRSVPKASRAKPVRECAILTIHNRRI